MLDQFMEVYERHLIENMKKNPKDYYGFEKVPEIVQCMRIAIQCKGYLKDTESLRKVCEELNIPHTYEAINQFCGVNDE